MTLETSVNLLIQKQEEILNQISGKITEWNSKIDSTGGLLSGKLDLSTFGTIDVTNEKVGIGILTPTDLLTLKSPTVDEDTILSILSNQNGSAVIKLGIDNLFDPLDIFEHGSNIEFNSTHNKTILLKDKDDSFNINHEGSSGLFVNCQNDVNITFTTKNIERISIAKTTGNILINTDIDDVNYKLQVNGSVSLEDSLCLKNKISFTSTDPIISQTVDTSYIRLCGGSKWIESGACILLTGKNEPNKPNRIEFFNTPLGTPSLVIDNQKNVTFSGKLKAPTIQLETVTVDNTTILPQIIFNDPTQAANNRLWQLKSENSDLIIRTLDDNNNPGSNVIRFIRSAGNNDLSKILFGQSDDIGLDILTPAITINNLAVIGPRQTGWTNIANPTNLSKDLQSISSDNTALAKVVRALISDLISHGLIGQ